MMVYKETVVIDVGRSHPWRILSFGCVSILVGASWLMVALVHIYIMKDFTDPVGIVGSLISSLVIAQGFYWIFGRYCVLFGAERLIYINSYSKCCILYQDICEIAKVTMDDPSRFGYRIIRRDGKEVLLAHFFATGTEEMIFETEIQRRSGKPIIHRYDSEKIPKQPSSIVLILFMLAVLVLIILPLVVAVILYLFPDRLSGEPL